MTAARYTGRAEQRPTSVEVDEAIDARKRADCSAAPAASHVRRRTSAAELARLVTELSERDWAILRDVYRCRLMAGGQLQRLHFPLDAHATLPTAARAARR